MSKVAFLINPKIRNLKKVLKIIESEFANFSPSFFYSNYPGYLFVLPSEIISKGYDTLIAVGGDGTLNEMLNGVINHFKTNQGYNWEEIRKIKLGIYPSGSGNDFARNIYTNGSFNLKELLSGNKTREVDIGLAEFTDKVQNPTQRFFINITDLGIGGLVAQLKSQLPRFIPPGINYFISIIYSFLTYQKKHVKIEGEDYFYEGKLLSYAVANGKFFGKGLGVAPHAEIDDGKFAITNIGDVSLLDYAIHSKTVRKVKKIIHKQVHYDETSKSIYLISTKNEKIQIDMDGEFVGFTPIKVHCLKNKVTFLS